MDIKQKLSLHEILTEGFIILFMISMLYSKFLLSISMIGLLLLTIFKITNQPSFGISIREDLKTNFRSFLKSYTYISISLVFFVVVLSGINTHNIPEWLHHLKLKIPFLILPFVFYSFDEFHKKRYYRYYYYFIIIMCLSMLGVALNYMANLDAINLSIKHGKSIPTPIDHIKFSLMVALTVVTGIVLYWEKIHFKYKWESKIFLVFSLFAFIFLHVLAVRSGIVTAYIALIYLIGYRSWKSNKKYGILAILGLISIPFIAYIFIPSFQNKINYMKYDMEMYMRGKGDDFSDAGRIYSYYVALNILNENPLLGIGIGDLREECTKKYEELYPNKNLKFKFPHNQYLFILSGIGVVGLIMFLIGILYPLLTDKNYKDNLFAVFMVIILTSFLAENTIERSYSTAFYLFFVLIALNYRYRDSN